ncbi:MAG TPA: M48 family metalloprotease [Bradyrhizobium sp.]|nr:M48 family metalloprotease [Bradyrhizobium sp.]
MRCAHEGGEAALRKLLVRLDPDLGRRVQLVAVNGGGFVVTSTPGERIFLYRSAMTEIESAALPALLAHELSHIRHGDAMSAVIRHNGFVSTWAAIMDGSGRRMLVMDFSGLEERRADLEAMQMMRSARIPLAPAAKMFEEMRVSKAQRGFYGYDLRDFHFGIDARAQRWAAASRSDPSAAPPLLTGQDSDDLYNFCWTGPIKALPGDQKRAPMPAPPGQGGLTPAGPSDSVTDKGA